MDKYLKAVRALVPKGSPKHLQSIVATLQFAGIDPDDTKLVGEVVEDWYARHAKTVLAGPTISTDPMSGLAGGIYDAAHTDMGRCPACRGPMVGVTLAHNRDGTYCPLHRVVIPDRVMAVAEVDDSDGKK